MRAAKALGWGSCVWFQELVAVPADSRAGAGHEALEELKGTGQTVAAGVVPKSRTKEEVGVDHVIHDIQELRGVWPEVFKQAASSGV